MTKISKSQKAENDLARQDRKTAGVILAKVFIPVLVLYAMGFWYAHDRAEQERQDLLPRLEEQTYFFNISSPDSAVDTTSIAPTHPQDTLQDDLDSRIEDALNRIMD